MTRKFLLPALSALLLAACSDDPAPLADSPAPAPPPIPAPGLAPAPDAAQAASTETVGGDGSPLILAPLAPDDGAALEGELACAFIPDAEPGAEANEERPILLARADVTPDARSRGVVRIGDYVETVTSRDEGGYDAMVNGAAYGGRGLDVQVRRLSDHSLTRDREGLEYPATLQADRMDGARRVWAGAWRCGP